MRRHARGQRALTNQVLVEYLAELGHTTSVFDALGAYVGMKMADCVADLERRFRTTLPPGFVEAFRARTAVAFSDLARATETFLRLHESPS